MSKWAYNFRQGEADGAASMKELLGGKGAGLAEMARLGLPVPPGFTLTTEVCGYFYAHDKTLPPDLSEQLDAALARTRRRRRPFLRRSRLAAARLRALGQSRLDAGHDGHGAQSRAQRQHRRRLGQKMRRRAFRLRLLPTLHRNVFLRRARRRASRIRGGARTIQGAARDRAGRGTSRGRLARRRRALQGDRGRAQGRGFSAEPA